MKDEPTIIHSNNNTLSSSWRKRYVICRDYNTKRIDGNNYYEQSMSIKLVTVATIIIIIIIIIIEKIPPVILTFQCTDVGERKQVLETFQRRIDDQE